MTTDWRMPWLNEDGSTNVVGFLAAYRLDKEIIWRADSRHIIALLEAVIEQRDEIINDINEFIDRSEHELRIARLDSEDEQERSHLFSEMQGLLMVKEWLTEYYDNQS